ncbi:MAG TPA: sialate O-acetylesterase [Bacteroidia bacterium]|nr:sialate O-acetylesterase [Bacteroidia bacterium]
MKRTPVILAFLLSALMLSSAQAGLKLPALVGHHMVLQRDLANPIWGWADPGAGVTVSIAGQTHQATADDQGKWKIALNPMQGSSHALKMTIASKGETIVLSNIVVGEVWICSGQSNMQWAVGQSNDADLETQSANYPNIRLISVPQVGTQEKKDDFDGQWEICTPETVGSFSGVGYFFGRQLHQILGVPIGLIDNSWGGSAAEAWVSRETMEADPRFASVMEQWKKTEATYDHEKAMADWKVKAEEAKAAGQPAPRQPNNPLTGNARPGNIWAGVLHPTIGYGIRGTIWYQGESNASRAYQYDDLFSLMISEWRKAWGIGDFPFYWVQLADFKAEQPNPGESDWAELREAQTNTLALPNTGQAVIYDLGEAKDIHPRDKQDVGKRLARIALARDYGVPVDYQSPSYKSMEVKDGKAILTFENVGSTGLYAFDTNEVVGFAVAGEDKAWHWATAKVVDADKVEVTCAEVAAPVAVRYAWADNPVANLRNKLGLPVVPFRTDDWPQITDPANAPKPAQ